MTDTKHLLVFFALVCACTAYWGPDLPPGPYCGKTNGCCNDRQDSCAHRILNTLCYCDEFCNRTRAHDDCCPDYEPVCLGLTPGNLLLPCQHNGKSYFPEQTRTEDCNLCECVKDPITMNTDWHCEDDPCLMSNSVVEGVNRGGSSWRAYNYPEFRNKKLKEGLIYKLGPEYGTMEAAWKGGMVEAERLSDLHLGVRDRLVNDVIAQIKNWQKDTYHKSMIQLKERKEMDEAFKKAQKPWAKLLQKVERTRLEYHTACKQERTAQNQERNASGDSSLSPDQVKKMAERVSKCREEVSKSREKYQAALAEITGYNPRYIEDMTAVFERCQQMEAQRLTFFKDVLFSFHKCLNISQEPTLPQIYEEFHHTINNADHQKDLKWWANNHGVNMAMAWPQFEEYTEEFRDIAKGKSKESLPTGPITLLNQRPVSEDELPPINSTKTSKNANHTDMMNSTQSVALHNNTPSGNNTIDKKTISAPIAVTIERLDIFMCTSKCCRAAHAGPRPARDHALALNADALPLYTITEINPAVENGTASAPKSGKTSPSKEGVVRGEAVRRGEGRGEGRQENPFEEEEWEEEGGALEDSGEPGVPVRALYDYTGAESDELSFRQGDLFEKLEDEDEQGWCKGRKDGRVGLYPANYVEPVGH